MAPIKLEEDRRAPDPFCVDKNIRSWASSRILYRGRDYYRKGKVLSLDAYEDEGTVPKTRIAARVEGTLEEPYRVEIRFDACGAPLSKCACPFNMEPLCKHAVAALIAWQQQETGSEPELGYLPPEDAGWADDGPARKRYLEELSRVEREARRARAKEQGLRIVQRPAGSPLGAYGVSSGDAARKGETYQVTVRDSRWQFASCTCTDYRTNELDTCKHIERVRLALERKGAGRLSAAERRSRRVWVYLGSRPSHEDVPHPAEEIRFHLPPAVRNQAPSWLLQSLDGEGYLRNGRDPSAQKAHFEGLLRRLGAEAGARVEVEGRVREILGREEETRAWENRIEALAKDPARHPAWRNSVGSMKIRLHPYQVEGILFAAKKRRAFIGDDMGLGKTVEAIGAALLLKELGAVRHALVIAPNSLKFQWRNEIQKVCEEGVTVISGGARERSELYRKGRTFFTVLNYELLYRDLGPILRLRHDLVILDEAQRIKNWETKIAQTVRRLEAPFRLVLTGTPLENRLPELHSISEFLNPKALGAAWKLVPTYARLDDEDRIVGYTRLDHLRGRLGRYLIRRTRQEVLTQLPKRTDNNFWTSITPEQAEVHDGFSQGVMRLMNKWKKFKRLTREDMNRLMMLLNSMRIVSNAYGQYDWKPIEREVLAARSASAELKKKIGSPKLEEFRRIMEDLLEVPGQKVVVFSQWERMIFLADLYIRDLLEQSQSRAVLFSGRLPLKKREAEIRRFAGDPATRVFFSTDAGGVGLNLQEASSCVVNLEIPWNPSVLEQRIGRVHRMGQKKSVQVLNLISSECIESRIFGLVARKKALFAGVFDPKTTDIRFGPKDMASFMDKMKNIFPEAKEAGGGETPGARDTSEAPIPEAAVEAAADSPPPSRAGGPKPAMEFDIGPAVAALAKFAGKEPPPGPAVLRISEDPNQLHLAIPKPAAEILRGLKPILETLLKLSA